jgi:hypothetical protein
MGIESYGVGAYLCRGEESFSYLHNYRSSVTMLIFATCIVYTN